MSSILTSDRLISSIKRRGFIPRSQETFSNDDFLEMATEEINLGLMQQLIDARGDYLVYFLDVPFVADVNSYTIPSRSHGSKLRNAKIIDENENIIHELTQIDLDDELSHSSFYMQNDAMIMHDDAIRTEHSIRMWFYLRPNKLVLNARAGTISQLSTTTEADNLSPLAGTITAISVSATAAIVTCVDHGLTSGKVIITATDSTPVIDGTHTFTYIDEDTFSVPVVTTVVGTTGAWSKGLDVTVATFPTFPSHFSTAFKYDVVGAESPNKIIHFNIYPNALNSVLKTISFTASEMPDLVTGDYITKAEETIVPNIPTELHPIVAQRVAVACLEAMGDAQNFAIAEKKLAQMEKSALKIITNRVEGAPKKIKNRFGTLSSPNKRW